MSLPAIVWRDDWGTTAVLAGTLTATEATEWLQANAAAVWTAVATGKAVAQTFDARGACTPWQPGQPLPGSGGRLVIVAANII